MGFDNTKQTQLCFVVPKEDADKLNIISKKMGVTRSQFLRKGTIEFLNYHDNIFKRNLEAVG